MRTLILSGCVLAVLAVPAAAQTDPLARARTLYNERQFDAAIAAADEARALDGKSDSADLITARALLEKYRETAEPADLEGARDRLRTIDVAHLSSRERPELLVGLGEALYLDDAAGAAAELFDALLEAAPGSPTGLAPDARERVVDWWATALDQEARSRPDSDRPPLYRRIRARMRTELAATPSSSAASYWLAAAALAEGDPQAAWDAAMAAWVRAPLAGDHAAALRGDLDLLVQHAIIPERSRQLAESVDACKAEWDAFKKKWEK